MDTQTALTNYFRAAFPCICLKTAEELRALSDIQSIAKKLNKMVWRWDAHRGLVRLNDDRSQQDTQMPANAFQFIIDQNLQDSIFVFLDIHQFAQEFQFNGVLSRAFKNLLQQLPEAGSSLVVLGTEFNPWSSIESYVQVLDYQLPDASTLKMIAKEVEKSAGKKSADISEDVIRALSGMSTSEAENALSLSMIECGNFSAEIIYREKIAAVKRSGLLSIIQPDPRGLDAIGGLENLKNWILKRKQAFSNAAENFGLPAPRGVLLVGVPGTGKSLSAKAFGTALGIPTLKFDIGSVFSSLVGDSEAKIRAALELANAMSPCVLWIDECDKGLSGAQGSGANDSGVTRRVFDALLGWMNERTKPVFIAATANQIQNLPVEFLRKGGRFDEIFYLDLPNADEREQIIKVQLEKNKRNPKDFDISAIVDVTENFSGAEIDSMVVEALYNAYDAGDKKLETRHLIDAANTSIPLAKTMQEQINAIRQWGAEGRGKPASKQTTKRETTGKRKLVTES